MDKQITLTSPKATQLLADLVTWVDDHKDCGVDPGAFRDACDEILRALFSHAVLRMPAGVFGRGVITLDLACSLMGQRLPNEVAGLEETPEWSYHLPGLREYRNMMNQEG